MKDDKDKKFRENLKTYLKDEKKTNATEIREFYIYWSMSIHMIDVEVLLSLKEN